MPLGLILSEGETPTYTSSRWRVGNVGTISRRITSKEINFNIGTWNVRTLGQAGRLKNLTSERDKCELNVVALSDVRWSGKGEIVSGIYTMFYSGGVKAEKVLQ